MAPSGKNIRVQIIPVDAQMQELPGNVPIYLCNAHTPDELLELVWIQACRHIQSIFPQEASYYMPRDYMTLYNTQRVRLNLSAVNWKHRRLLSVTALICAIPQQEDAQRAVELFNKYGARATVRQDPIVNFSVISSEIGEDLQAIKTQFQSRLQANDYHPLPLKEVPARPSTIDPSLPHPDELVSLSVKVPLGAIDFVTAQVRSVADAFMADKGHFQYPPVHRDNDPVPDDHYWMGRSHAQPPQIQAQMLDITEPLGPLEPPLAGSPRALPSSEPSSLSDVW